MDKDFVSPEFSGRPIILSPPPMERASSGFPTDSLHYQRNQSVGYNLQQEFEALKADLDLDLSHSNDGVNDVVDHESSSASSNIATGVGGVSGPISGNSGSHGGHGPSSGSTAGSRVLSGGANLLLSGANASSTNFGLSPSFSDNLMRDRALSPGAGNSGGLQALLNNKSTGFLPNLTSVPARPQSVNDFSNLLPRLSQPFSRVQQSNFYLDMLAFTAWIENLSPQDMLLMLDYWCNNLPFDILLTMRSKLEAHTHLSQAGSYSNVSYPNYAAEYMPDVESMSLDAMGHSGAMSHLSLVQPKPKTNTFRSHLFVDPKVQRPKLADPMMKPQGASGQAQFDRARSPTSHLYEKTSFLRLAAASGNSPHAFSQQMPNSSEEGLDMSATSKLGALATINSRVALDSNRKNYQLGPNRQNALAYEELINRAGNSSSVPAPTTQKYSTAAMGGMKKKEVESPVGVRPSTPVGNTSMPNEIASMELLNNIPAWLKLLRLHKYTDSLKDIYWKDLVELSDEQLEEKGVKALGARRKLLKAFDTVKQARS